MPRREELLGPREGAVAGALIVILVAGGLLPVGLYGVAGALATPAGGALRGASASFAGSDGAAVARGWMAVPLPERVAAPPLTAANSTPAAEAGTVIGTVPAPSGPYGVAYDPLNGFLYVADRGNNSVTIVNGTRLVATVAVGLEPLGVVFDPSNGFVYVSNYGSSNLTLISGESVVGWVTDPSFSGPCFPAYDPRDQSLYVPNVNGYGVSVVNGTTVVTFLPTGTYPFAAAYDPASGYVYVSNDGAATRGGSTVTVLENVTVVATLSGNFSNPSGIAVDGANGLVYVANKNISSPGGGFVTLLNGLSIVARIAVGPELWGAAYDPANRLVYVVGNDVDEANASTHANTLAALNGSSVVAFLPIGLQPYGLAYDPQDAYLSVGVGGSNTVAVVSTALALGATTSAYGGTVGSRDVGSPVNFSAPLWANGSGNGTEQIAWSPAPMLACGGSGTMRRGALSIGSVGFPCSAASPGAGTIWINVSDSVGGTAWSRIPFQVFPTPMAAPPVASTTTLDVGQRLTIQESVADPGSGGDTFAWTATSELDCSPSSATIVQCLANATGSNATARVVVTDSNGGESNATSSSLTVHPDPAITAPVIRPSSIALGASVSLSVSVSGGSGGNVLTWYGLPPGCSGAGSPMTCRPSQSGSYRISASVNDSAGFVASSAASFLNVSATPASPSIFGLSPTAFYAVIAAVIVVAFTGAIGVRLRRRSPSPRAPSGGPGPSEPPSTPPKAP